MLRAATPKDAFFFPLLITFPQPSTKLPLTAHYSNTKSGKNCCQVAQWLQGERISLGAKGRCWWWSLGPAQPLHCPPLHPAPLSSCPKAKPRAALRFLEVFWGGISMLKMLLIVGPCQSVAGTVTMTPKAACGHRYQLQGLICV